MKIHEDFSLAIKVIMVAFGLFIISLAITALHEYIWKSEIIYYAFNEITAVYTVFSAIIMLILRMFSNRLKKLFCFSTIILSSTILCLLSYSFNITFPVTIDRSFSINMLGALYKLDRPVPLAELDSIVYKYFHENGRINKRIKEQLATGSIVMDEDLVELTERGKSIVKMNIMLGRIFSLDMNNIAPE